MKKFISLSAMALIALAFGYGLGVGLRSQAPVVHSIARAESENPSIMVNIFVSLSKKMVPSVVNIFTNIAVRMPWGRSEEGAPNDLWRHFFEEFFGADPYSGGGPGGSPVGRVQSLGSGFILETSSDSALILTNNHVVDNADEIKVKFTEATDEKETTAEVVGRDVDLDVALLRVKVKRKLIPVVLGDSDKLEQGEWVMAVGNPFGHGHSVTTGVVSAKERTLPGSYANYLQVDAPINPGNSGGPLANLNGQVVGINNAVQMNAQGIGFAIPINSVKGILPQLKTKGHVDRGYVGVNIDDLRPDLAKTLKVDADLKAPLVTNVIKGSPAEKAGLQAYDVITEVNGKTVNTAMELINIITQVPIGDNVRIKFLRQGKEQTLAMKVAKRPVDREGRTQRGGKTPPKRRMKIDAGMRLEQIDEDIRKELDLPSNFEGIVVTQVRPGGAADKAGLTRGDIILEVDRKRIKNLDDFYGTVQFKKNYLLRIRQQDGHGNEKYAVVSLNLAELEENEGD